jgi:hypothetical protein
MSSIETLAKRVQERDGKVRIDFTDVWRIVITLPNYQSMVFGVKGDKLSKVANKANGVFK